MVDIINTRVPTVQHVQAVIIRDNWKAIQNRLKNVEINDTLTSTPTADTTTTLNLNSTGIQEFTGTSTQVVLLPDTSTLTAGKSFKFINNSTDEITLKDFTEIITLTTLSSNTNATVICLSTVSQAWEVEVNVGNPSLVSIDSQHILGRISSGNGTVESLSKANVKSILGYLETEQDFADLIQAQSNIVSSYGDWLIPVVNITYRTVDYFTAYNYKTYVLTGLAISDVSGLTTTLSNKQATLVNQTNIKSINGNSLLGSGDLTVASSSDLGSIVLYLESIGLINLVVNGNGDYVTDTNGNYIHTTFTKNIVTTG